MSFLKYESSRQMFAAPGMINTQIKYVELEVEDNAYYVYNIGNNEGFVIASGNDCAEPILGYSYTGSFDPANVPSNMQAWLDGYVKQIQTVKNDSPARKYATGNKHTYKQAIPTLVPSRWNQDSPYNDQCPDFNDNHGHRPTGCVATAMSQVMYYHKWPKDVVGEIPGYKYEDLMNLGGNGSIRTLDAMPEVTFDWDNMLDIYQADASQASREAVATLMRYAGASVQMAYCPHASGAQSSDIPNALRTYFGYDKGVRYLDARGYTSFEWADILYNELAQNRPILYSATAPNIGGHQFICDGYENEYFHFNWGWGGMSDGYFKIEALTPEQQGIGGAGNGMHFSNNHHAVIGIQPPVGGSEQLTEAPFISFMTLYSDYNGQYTKNDKGDITIYANTSFAYNGEEDADFNIGFGLFDADGKLVSVIKQWNKPFYSGWNTPESNDIKADLEIKGSSIANDGTYYVRAIIKNSDWELTERADKVYFKLDVTGNDVQLTQYPLVDVEITDMHFEGTLYQEAEAVIKATIINKGDDFEGTLYLAHNNKLEPSYKQTIVMKKGEKKEVEIAFIASEVNNETGEDSYGIAINGREFCDQITGTFIKSETTSSNIKFKPIAGFTAEGNSLNIPTEVTNVSGKNRYNCFVRATLYIKTGYVYKEVTSTLVTTEVEPKEKVTIDVHFDNLDFGTTYYLGFSTYQNGKEKIYGGLNQQGSPNKVFSKYITADALAYYDVTGHMDYKVIAEGETFDIPAEACFVTLPNEVNNRTINKSANPNCIYKVNYGVSLPSSLKDCNVVKGDKAYGINLTDANAYYANEYIATEGASVEVNVEDKVTTLWLPFIPEKATIDGVELVRGTSLEEMETADYALIPFVAEEEATIYCEFIETASISPCVLKVDSKYVGKTIVFSTTDDIVINLNNKLNGYYFDINVSNQTSEFAESVYGFTETEFVNDCKKVSPFRVYLTSASSSVAKVKVVYPEVSGIEGVENDDLVGKMVNVYSIDGVKVRTVQYGDKMLEGLPVGLYIVNGQKFVK